MGLLYAATDVGSTKVFSLLNFQATVGTCLAGAVVLVSGLLESGVLGCWAAGVLGCWADGVLGSGPAVCVSIRCNHKTLCSGWPQLVCAPGLVGRVPLLAVLVLQLSQLLLRVMSVHTPRQTS